MDEAQDHGDSGMTGGASRHDASRHDAAQGGAAGDGASDEEIRRRAYELYESRGGSPGSDMDDWLTAEREMRERRAGPGQGGRSGARGRQGGTGKQDGRERDR